MLLTALTGTAPCPCCAYAHAQAAMPSMPLRGITSWLTGMASAPAAVAAPVPPRDLRIENVTIVDPRDGSKARGMSIAITLGRITDIFPTGSKQLSPQVQVVDGTGKFVVPGYNDMHSHVLELPDPSGSLALMLAEGVTGFRQMSGSPALLAARRAGKLPIGELAPALLETPGSLLTPFNAGSADAVIEEIRRQKAQGADFVKVGMIAPEVFFVALEEGRKQGIALLGHLQEGTDALDATAAGFRSVEHLGPGSTVWICCSDDEAELRADSYRREVIKAPPFKIPFLETLVMKKLGKMLINPSAFAKPGDVDRLQRAIHSFNPDKGHAVAERFREDGSWHVPTMVRLRTQEYAELTEYEQDEMLAYMPARAVKNWREVTARFKALPATMRHAFRDAYPRQLELAKLLCDSGVRMMAGTDGGSYLGPGLTLKQEFAELALAGISPLRILQMATVDPADYLGRSDAMGRVAIGYDADLLLLDADPLARVEHLHGIAAVVRAGAYHSAQALDTLRRTVAEKRGTLH
ncbi:amidohydrolase family protein [Novosphingobium terrae]|uniref:amidohydrolase family protein n=1 Tax=Novosphingobium terrae TaxID=2726189 RepID=UPI00198126A9|nr:amidohydrolase family protein [Novosphingobium terrae]